VHTPLAPENLGHGQARADESDDSRITAALATDLQGVASTSHAVRVEFLISGDAARDLLERAAQQIVQPGLILRGC
jgi:hypothetical protein